MASRSRTFVKLKEEFKTVYPEWVNKKLEILETHENGRALLGIDQYFYQFIVAARYFEIIEGGNDAMSRDDVVNVIESPFKDNSQFIREWKEEVNNLFKPTEEKQTMTNKTNRRVLNIQLLDNDAGLPVEHALVAEFNGVVTEDNDQTTLQEIISTGEVAERIKVHNEVRAKQLDLAILKSTGQKVNLLPIKLKDLTWNIK